MHEGKCVIFHHKHRFINQTTYETFKPLWKNNRIVELLLQLQINPEKLHITSHFDDDYKLQCLCYKCWIHLSCYV